MADKYEQSREVGELHVKVNVDVSEALVGLKAIQREAREATKALRELEAAQKRTFGETRTEGRRYGKSTTWTKEPESITDDIRRSYE